MDKDKINKLIGVKENYKAPEKLMSILKNKGEREKLFKQFLQINDDLSQDFFRSYFQQQQADRGNNKQDFTPNSIATLCSLIVGNGKETLDDCCGTGTLTLAKWWNDVKTGKYSNENHYTMIELTEAALPFLLFNMMIRGINATVINGNVLTKENNKIYELENAGQFSNIKLGSEQLSLV